MTTPGHATQFRNIAEMLSNETHGHSVSVENLKDEDSLSIVSTPYWEPNVSSVFRLASSLLQKGELENSQMLFEKALKYAEKDAPLLETISIRMQIAAVKMYRGNYEESSKNFLDLQREINNFSPSKEGDIPKKENLLYHCLRWLTICMLLAGDWQSAVSKMEALLKNYQSRPHLRLYRDLALAYAHLGDYRSARKYVRLAEENVTSSIAAHSEKSPKQEAGALEKEMGETPGGEMSSSEYLRTLHIKQGKELRTKEKTVQVAAAALDMLSGNYAAALVASSDSFNFMNKNVGAQHFKTLAVATLRGWCLAYNGRYIEAELLCTNTYKALTRALGRRHPQTLEVMECLVYIFRSQGRFAEAIGTGRSLDSLSRDTMKVLGRCHPLPIRAKFQLAESLFANGDYVTSKTQFQTLLAETGMQLGHPEILKYKSEQARVLLYLGNFDDAQLQVLDVAAEQFDLLCQNQDCGADFYHLQRSQRSRDGFERMQNLYNLLSSIPTEIPIHPFLASSMQLLASIEIRRFQQTGNGDRSVQLTLARQILEVLQSRQLQETIEATPLSTSVEFDLAMLMKEENSRPHDLEKSIELFNRVYDIRKKSLGDNHLDTLYAQRELIIASCLQYIDPDDDTLTQTKKQSDYILQSLKSRLGALHPETLTTQLWCFTLNSLLQDDHAYHENLSWKVLSQNLSNPYLMHERLVETFFLKKKLAGLLNGIGDSQAALELVNQAILQTEDAITKSENEGLKEVISGFRNNFVDLRTSISHGKDM